MNLPIGYRRKDFDKLPIPKIPAATLKEIGRFMVMWGLLESELETLVAAIYRIETTFSLTITASLNTKAKVEMLRSAIDMLREPLGEDFVKEADKRLVEVTGLANGTRNIIAHGVVADMQIEPGKFEVRFQRIYARKRLELVHYPATVKDWQEQTENVISLASILRSFIPHIVETVATLNPEDYDRLCVTR